MENSQKFENNIIFVDEDEESKQATKIDGQIKCLSCTFLNHPSMNFCELCDEQLVREDSKPIQTSSSNQLQSIKYNLQTTHSSKPKFVSSVKPTYSSFEATEGIIELLKEIPESKDFTFAVPYPFHFSQKGSLGSKWSCGYRNIQMLVSSLMQIEEYRNVLFNGDGIIPTILEIQLWIEKAWQSGFDVEVRSRHFCFLIFVL